MPTLTREQFLNGQVKTVPVEISTGTALVRGMTSAALADCNTIRKASGEDDYTKAIILQSLVDNDGQRLLNDDDYTAIATLPAGDINAIVDTALRLSGLTRLTADDDGTDDDAES